MAWIGAQHYSPPQFHSDQDLSLEKTIADTVIDTDTSGSSITQTWTQRSLQQKSQRKRKRSNCHQRSLQSDNFDEQDTQQNHFCSIQQNQGLSPQCSSHSSACEPKNDTVSSSQEHMHYNMQQPNCVSRDTDEWAESVLEFLEGIIQDTLQYTSPDSTFRYHRNNTDSEASSIISFLRERGPYHGWEYDEYFGEHFSPTQPERQQAEVILPIAHSGSDGSSSRCDGSQSRTSRADTWSQGQDPLLHSPQSSYWNSRSVDSNGSLRIAVNKDRFSYYGDVPSLTPESHSIPTPLRWAWYRPQSDDDDTDEDIQVSQRSLEDI